MSRQSLIDLHFAVEGWISENVGPYDYQVNFANKVTIRQQLLEFVRDQINKIQNISIFWKTDQTVQISDTADPYWYLSVDFYTDINGDDVISCSITKYHRLKIIEFSSLIIWSQELISLYSVYDHPRWNYNFTPINLCYPGQRSGFTELLPEIIITPQSFQTYKVGRLRASLNGMYPRKSFELNMAPRNRFEMLRNFCNNVPTIAVIFDQDFYEIAPIVHLIKVGNQDNNDLKITDFERIILPYRTGDFGLEVIVCNCPEHNIYHSVCQSLNS